MKIATLALTTLLTLGIATPAYAQTRVVLSGSDGHVQVVIGGRRRNYHSRHRHHPYHRGRYYYRRPSPRRYRVVRSRRYSRPSYYRVRHPDYGRYPNRRPYYRYDHD